MTTEELASASLEALNLLSHVASAQHWEELRRAEGDEALRNSLERAGRTVLDLFERVRRGPNPGVFPRPADAERALQQFLELLPALAMDDLQAIALLRAQARQVLEALGFQIAE